MNTIFIWYDYSRNTIKESTTIEQNPKKWKNKSKNSDAQNIRSKKTKKGCKLWKKY